MSLICYQGDRIDEEHMVQFTLNDKQVNFQGDETVSLLHYLRETAKIKSVKDGCSGQAVCGACLVEMEGQPLLSCVTKLKKINGRRITTLEGIPDQIKNTIARAFVTCGAVQCGFCTPGFVMRTHILLQKQANPDRQQIIEALKNNYCRCTGYHAIIEAVQLAAQSLYRGKEIKADLNAAIGAAYPKYGALEKALGINPFVNDLHFDQMLYGALKLSDHARAKILKIDYSQAEKLAGVHRVFTASHIPGQRIGGLIVKDWPLMIAPGETSRYIGDVIACVAAESESIARQAVKLIRVEYDVLEPLSDLTRAENSPIHVHANGNLLDQCVIRRGEAIDSALEKCDYIVSETYETQRIEHAFAETETAIALPDPANQGIKVYSQSQGVYEDQQQLARILDLPPEQVNVIQIPNGGGFGGKEDLSVQGHAALMSYLLKRPVKVHLSRPESIIMHPKRHPMQMHYILGCSKEGRLLALKARILGDTGAYASVGMKVLERAAGHATGAYHIPNVDITAKTLYTNNIPCGAMRGFGVNQATFAMESCIDLICCEGSFDRWQFRYDNAMKKGSLTATGQILGQGVGVRACLLALKKHFYEAKYAGLACGIKNTGIGNGMTDFSEVKIEIKSEQKVIIHHGWTEMGQGINTVALQTLHEETGIAPDIIQVKVNTRYQARSGMTTASRGTSLLGNGIINAARKLKEDLKKQSLADLKGRIYHGVWRYEKTTPPGQKGPVITHYSYGYAAQLVIVDEQGKIEKIVAAHDAGKIINKTLFKGQIQGAVHMGLGYALSEDLPMEKSRLKSTRLRDLGIIKMADMPPVEVIGVEEKDPLGPYGAKGVGEIGLVPTAGAVANALTQFDGKKRNKLPLNEE